MENLKKFSFTIIHVKISLATFEGKKMDIFSSDIQADEIYNFNLKDMTIGRSIIF